MEAARAPAGIILVRAAAFSHQLAKLDEKKTATVEVKVGLLMKDPRDPALRSKKLTDCKNNHYEARVNAGDRIIFHWRGPEVTLLAVGSHDDTQRWIKANC